MKFKVAVGALLGVLAALQMSSAKADVVFSDNFNSYAYQLNWVPPANWTVPGQGAVDLIGETTTQTQFDFYPGNGGYVDLDGSNGLPGTLQTTMSFTAGSYTLSFDLGGNARGDGSKTTVVTLGNFSQTITLGSDDPLAHYILTVDTSGGELSFSDLPGGNGNIGNILDNVSIASAVPEPSTWMMMVLGFAGVGFAAYRRRNNGALRAT
jgi:hypothetical protein